MPNNGSTTIFSGGKLPTKHRFSSPAATSSAACPSFRIYYYDSSAGSIPFEWESHPGTPKHPSSDLPPLPPLTPPPSHFSSFSGHHHHHHRRKKPTKMKILKLLWFHDHNNNKVKKLSSATSSPSMSERNLIDDEYDLFKFDQSKGKVNVRRFSSFDSSIVHYPPPPPPPPTIRRSNSTSCFGCFIW